MTDDTEPKVQERRARPLTRFTEENIMLLMAAFPENSDVVALLRELLEYRTTPEYSTSLKELRARGEIIKEIIRAKRDAGVPMDSVFFSDVWPPALAAWRRQKELCTADSQAQVAAEEDPTIPVAIVPLRVVMWQMVLVVDTLNRDRSFELATRAQGALEVLSDLQNKLDEFGHADWWTTPPVQWDESWRPMDQLLLWRPPKGRTCRHGTILYGAKCLRCARGEP